MNPTFMQLLQSRGVDESTAYYLARHIQQELFHQFNETTHISLRSLDYAVYDTVSPPMYAIAEEAPSPVIPEYSRIEHVAQFFGFRIGSSEIILKLAYSGLQDTLFIDPYIHIDQVIQYRPHRHGKTQPIVLFPVCPRCGSKNFKCHGAELPKFLRVKQALTCKRCGHTAHTKEFK